ncbi:MAG TPA: hypothetical protein PLN64_04275, partial [Candidatus Bipolaricaulis anaerobius]|nr:hypothetical protein [Candidatus Bipolaricaulis anaerobius]
HNADPRALGRKPVPAPGGAHLSRLLWSDDRPHLAPAVPYLRLRERGIRGESYFLGALLGPLLILAASLGVLARQLGTPIIRTRVADA